MRAYFLILLVSLYYTSSNAEEDYGFEIIDLPSTTDESFEIVDWPTTAGETFEKVDKETTDESFEIIDNPKGDPELAAYIREALENFRKQMTNGIPEIKMPVLDPLVLDKDIDIDVNENVAKMHLLIKQLSIYGLSSFELLDVDADLEEFFLHLNISLPNLSARGYYNLDGKIYKIFPIHGSGNFTINGTGMMISGTGHLSFTGKKLQLTAFLMDLHWKTITMDMGDNFMGGGRFGNVLQEVIPGVGTDVFFRYKPLILRPLEQAITKKINKELSRKSVQDVINKILGGS